MADAFQRLIAQESDLVGAAHAQWGPQARDLIRLSIADHFKVQNSRENLLNLNHRPQIPGWSISISHAQGLGAWVALPSPSCVGLDVELISRLRQELIARISTAEEMAQAPQPSFLWCAKEASFKGRQQQPATISEIHIEQWSLEDGIWRFWTQTGSGHLIEAPPYILALYRE